MSNSVQYGDHTVLFREGEKANKLFIVKSGQVICLKKFKDRLIPIFLAKSQDLIGESAVLNEAPHNYSAIVLGISEVIEIPSRNFQVILKDAPVWLSDLTTTMVQRFQQTAGLVAENRIFHPSIMSEEEYPPALEHQFKNLLNQ